MARTKMNRRSANRVAVPMGATGGRTPPSTITVLLLATSIISAVWAAAMLTPFGRVAYVYFFAYSEYYTGVISLVSLSVTIMIGLVATDRLVLSIRQRVLLQSAHRTTGVIAVAALGLHLWTKLMEGHIRLVDTVVPFLSPGNNRVYVGLGTISGLIMITVMWTGLIRAWFVGRGRPWMWRSIHAISYLMWPIALVHGLSAGRTAATWVVVSYVLCVLAVLIGLAVRLSVSLNRRTDFSSAASGSLKPVGLLVPAAAPAPRRPVRPGEADPTAVPVSAARGARTAVLDPWSSPAPISPAVVPVGTQPTMASPPPLSSPPYDEELYRRGRSRRYADEEPPRGHRYADEEPPTARSVRPRHAQDEPVYEAAPPRLARRAGGEPDAPRYDPAPRRPGTGDVSAATGRHSRTEFVDLSDPNDPNYLPPDETPTLVDIGARRARKAAQQREGVRTAGRTARRARSRDDDGVADVQYWRQLRGEAQ